MGNKKNRKLFFVHVSVNILNKPIKNITINIETNCIYAGKKYLENTGQLIDRVTSFPGASSELFDRNFTGRICPIPIYKYRLFWDKNEILFDTKTKDGKILSTQSN